MRIAMLSPIAWRTPPRHYGPWELVTSLLTEELVRIGCDVTLFATAQSITSAKLQSVVRRGYEEDPNMDPKVSECLHIAHCFEQAESFDIIHNQFDFLPLTYSRLVQTPVVTTIHGFSSPKILAVYREYNASCWYVSISNADRSPELDYAANIYHGIDLEDFTFLPTYGDEYLLYFGRIHRDKGTAEAIEIARRFGKKLIIAGVIQDQAYFNQFVKPTLKPGRIEYIGSAGPEKRNQLLGNALALLHPIHFHEPFGLSVVESMACGTPVVAFAKGSMPEIITDGFDGFLVDTVEEAVERLSIIHSIDRKNCRKTVEKRFTKTIMAQKYMDLYRRILRKV